MQFIVSSQVLLKALQKISGIISSNPTLSITTNFLVELRSGKLILSATDIDTMITTECEVSKHDKEGSICMPSRTLLEYLKGEADQPLTFSIDDNGIIDIQSENGEYKLKGQDADEFPRASSLEDAQVLTVPTHVITDGTSYTLFSVSSDDNKRNMSGVHIESKAGQLIFVSTDLQRLVKYSYPQQDIAEISGVIVPKKPLQQLNSILDSNNTDVDIAFNEQFIKIKNSQVEIVTRLIDGNFPDYEMVIPKDPPYTVEVNKDDLENAIKRINIFANKSTNQIILDISNNKIKLEAEDIEFSSEGNETISCSYDGDPIKLSFNAKLLAELLHNLPFASIRIGLSAPTKPVVFVPTTEEDAEDELIMLIMPLVQ